MKINGRDIVFKERFRNALEDTIEYLEQFGNQPVKNFLKDLDYLLHERIPFYPESFPEYKKRLTTTKEYRRALFRKNYYVVYRLEVAKITYLYLYHSSRHPDNVFIE